MPVSNAPQGQPDQPTSVGEAPAVHVMEVTPAQKPPPSGPTPEPAPHNLQDVLPEISKLAQRVGGLDKLAELVQTLRGVRS